LPALDKQSVIQRDEVMDEFPGQLLRWAGAALIFLIGGAHLLIVGEHFLAATYLGLLFLANFFGSAVAAFALYWSPNRWGWLLGGLISGGAFVGFIVSRAVGLPGFEEEAGKWLSISGLLCLMMEGGFLTLALLALTPQGRALVRTQQERLDQEQEAGQKQPLEQPVLGMAPLRAPGLVEHEMAEIRSRTEPDLVDLRRQVKPQLVKERAQQSALDYLRAVRSALVSAPVRRSGPLAALVVLAATVLVLRRGSDREG
jgi:hypothetical protein